MESNILTVVKAILKPHQFISSTRLILEDCKQLLPSLNEVIVSFVKKSANKVAHLLARASYSMSDTCIFEGVALAFLATSLMADFID